MNRIVTKCVSNSVKAKLLKLVSLRNVLLLIFGGFWAWKGFDYSVVEPFRHKSGELQDVQALINDLKDRISIHKRYSEYIQNSAKSSLPADVTTAAVRYQEWLQQLCQSTGMSSPTIVLKDTIKEDGLGNKVQASIRGMASLKSVGDLIDQLSVAQVTHRISGVKMRDWDSATNRVQIELDLDALAMKENTNLAFSPSIVADKMRGLGDSLDRRNSFSRYVAPKLQPVEVAVSMDESEDLINSIPRPPLVDSLASIRLVGIVERDGVSRALFHDSLKGVDMTVDERRELQANQFVATAIRFEADRVILKQGAREFPVSLGQTIRESLQSLKSSDAIH